MKEIDWANLSFGYMRTDYNVRINFRNGKWVNWKSAVKNILTCIWRLLVCTMVRKHLKD